jgi:aryl-alcohol dehydrogenase-like predicted oxidoreductase
MMYREIGRTKLQVSALALGTVTLGTVYGFAANPVERQPSRDDALALIRHAVSQGVTLIDAAPAYGTAESLVGAAVGDNVKVVVVMKVIIRANTKSAGLLRALEASLASSRVAFHRGTLDIAQIHNATDASLAIPEVGDVLRGARDKGTVRFLSALAYTADEALAAISSGRIDVLQVPFSVLDQRVTTRVVDAARSAGVGVLSRSALLKGALIERAA